MFISLNAPIATKVDCFSRLLKYLRSLYGKQCGPRSDCSYRSSLFWVHAVWFYTYLFSICSRRLQQTTFSDAFFYWHFKGYWTFQVRRTATTSCWQLAVDFYLKHQEHNVFLYCPYGSSTVHYHPEMTNISLF